MSTLKKTICSLFLVMAGMTIHNPLQAQTVQLYDLDPWVYSDTTMSEAGHVRLNVSVKIKNVEQADSVYFMLGSTANASDVNIYRGKVSSSGSDYFVSVGTTQYMVYGNLQISNPLILTMAECSLFHFVSVQVKDVSGNLSNMVSIQIN